MELQEKQEEKEHEKEKQQEQEKGEQAAEAEGEGEMEEQEFDLGLGARDGLWGPGKCIAGGTECNIHVFPTNPVFVLWSALMPGGGAMLTMSFCQTQPMCGGVHCWLVNGTQPICGGVHCWLVNG